MKNQIVSEAEERRRKEVEATAFALALLMPEQPFVADIKNGLRLKALAEKYQVPENAVIARAYDVGFPV